MVAGATGIDLFLLVIDAAEGARPQTLEHLAILRLLGIEHGVVAVTKADAVDEETLELARRGGARARPGAPRSSRSARKTGAGSTSCAPRSRAPPRRRAARRRSAATRLYVDRVFTLRGIGTVVTGTLWSGTIGEGDELRVEPAGLDVRVRSVQVHDRPSSAAEAGQRVAVNLPGDRARASSRAATRSSSPASTPSRYRLDVALDELERGARRGHRPPRHRAIAGARRPRRRPLRAAAARAAGRRGARRPRRPAHAARRSAAAASSTRRRRDGSSRSGCACSTAATRPRSSRRSSTRRSPGRRCRRAACSPPDELARGLAALESRRRALRSRAAWLDELRDARRARLAERARRVAARPRPAARRAAAARPWAPPSRTAARRRAPRREGLPARARAPRSASAPRRPSGSRPSSPAGDAVKVDDRELAAFLEARDACAASATASPSRRDAVRPRRRDACRRQAPVTLAGFRDAMGISRRDGAAAARAVRRRRADAPRRRGARPTTCGAGLTAPCRLETDQHALRPPLAEAGEERDDEEEVQLLRDVLGRHREQVEEPADERRVERDAEDGAEQRPHRPERGDREAAELVVDRERVLVDPRGALTRRRARPRSRRGRASTARPRVTGRRAGPCAIQSTSPSRGRSRGSRARAPSGPGPRAASRRGKSAAPAGGPRAGSRPARGRGCRLVLTARRSVVVLGEREQVAGRAQDEPDRDPLAGAAQHLADADAELVALVQQRASSRSGCAASVRAVEPPPRPRRVTATPPDRARTSRRSRACPRCARSARAPPRTPARPPCLGPRARRSACGRGR